MITGKTAPNVIKLYQFVIYFFQLSASVLCPSQSNICERNVLHERPFLQISDLDDFGKKFFDITKCGFVRLGQRSTLVVEFLIWLCLVASKKREKKMEIYSSPSANPSILLFVFLYLYLSIPISECQDLSSVLFSVCQTTTLSIFIHHSV